MGDYGRVRVRREIIDVAPERCHRAWIELEDVLRNTLADLRGQAARKRLALRLSMPPDLPVVRGDAEQLLEFFTALLSAGIENTPENGRVSLDIERSQGCAILLSIADSGNGLPREEIEAAAGLFAPFGSLEVDGAAGPETRVTLQWSKERWRAHPENSRSRPGSGENRHLAAAPRQTAPIT
jgi:signal transduction histidine kinase